MNNIDLQRYEPPPIPGNETQIWIPGLRTGLEFAARVHKRTVGWTARSILDSLTRSDPTETRFQVRLGRNLEEK